MNYIVLKTEQLNDRHLNSTYLLATLFQALLNNIFTRLNRRQFR